MKNARRNPLEVLLVEDDPGDELLTREALKDASVRMHVATDGVAALAFLRREGAYQAAPRPDLVLLDLNLPRKGGREVLAEIRRDEQLQLIPVIILTTSNYEQDVRSCYSLQANCYVLKPVDFGEFQNMIRTLKDFWLTTVRLPHQ